MKYPSTFKLIFAVFLLGCGSTAVASNNSSKTYQDTRQLLSAMSSPQLNQGSLAALFRVGDQRLADLIQALEDPAPEISRRAQIIIRYLGDEVGMRALYKWYGKRQQFSVAGPIPLPLSEYDYKVIHANYIDQPSKAWSGAEKYIYALALDGSPQAKAALSEMIKSAGSLDEDTVAGSTIKRVQESQPAMLLTGQRNLAKLVQSNAFFIDPEDQKYTSARLLALNKAKDKALIEVYINRGALSEEWYHVVIKKCGQGWKFFSITQAAVS
jgi:hypothetical protein